MVVDGSIHSCSLLHCTLGIFFALQRFTMFWLRKIVQLFLRLFVVKVVKLPSASHLVFYFARTCVFRESLLAFEHSGAVAPIPEFLFFQAGDCMEGEWIQCDAVERRAPESYPVLPVYII